MLTRAKIRILQLLAQETPLSITEIARIMGTSRVNIYKHLKSLISEGYVKRIGRGVYVLTRKGREVVMQVTSSNFRAIIKGG